MLIKTIDDNYNDLSRDKEENETIVVECLAVGYGRKTKWIYISIDVFRVTFPCSTKQRAPKYDFDLYTVYTLKIV